jgi:hypothetical protein
VSHWSDGYPRRYWTEVDWQQWEREGKPPVGKDPFTLFPKPSRARDARGRQIDQLLKKLGV